MFRRPRGRALIINNQYFVTGKFKPRSGCENDVADLEKLFTAIDFDVEVLTNKTAQVTPLIIHK